MTMSQPAPSLDAVRSLSNEQLAETIERCEDRISDGRAEIEDYEAFVLCQKELSRRTWS